MPTLKFFVNNIAFSTKTSNMASTEEISINSNSVNINSLGCIVLSTDIVTQEELSDSIDLINQSVVHLSGNETISGDIKVELPVTDAMVFSADEYLPSRIVAAVADSYDGSIFGNTIGEYFIFDTFNKDPRTTPFFEIISDIMLYGGGDGLCFAHKLLKYGVLHEYLDFEGHTGLIHANTEYWSEYDPELYTNVVSIVFGNYLAIRIINVSEEDYIDFTGSSDFVGDVVGKTFSDFIELLNKREEYKTNAKCEMFSHFFYGSIDELNEYAKEHFVPSNEKKILYTYYDSLAKNNELKYLIDKNSYEIISTNRTLSNVIQPTVNSLSNWKNIYGNLSVYTIRFSGLSQNPRLRIIEGVGNKFKYRNVNSGATGDINLNPNDTKLSSWNIDPFIVIGQNNEISNDYVGFDNDLNETGKDVSKYTDILIGNNIHLNKLALSGIPQLSGENRLDGNVVINSAGNYSDYRNTIDSIAINGSIDDYRKNLSGVVGGVAIGRSAVVEDNFGTAIGPNYIYSKRNVQCSTRSGFKSVAIGPGATTTKWSYDNYYLSGINSNIAIGAGPGESENILGNYRIGQPDSTATITNGNHGSILIAVSQIPDSLLHGSYSEISAIKYGSYSSSGTGILGSHIDGNYSVGLGTGLFLCADNSIAIGKNITMISGVNNITIGSKNSISSKIKAVDSINIGNRNILSSNNIAIANISAVNIGNDNIIEGQQNNPSARPIQDFYVFGNGNYVKSGPPIIVIGKNNDVNVNSNVTNALNCAIVIGSSASLKSSCYGSILIGANTSTNSSRSIAIGINAVLSSAPAAVQLGPGTNTSPSSLQFLNTQVVGSNGGIVGQNISGDIAYDSLSNVFDNLDTIYFIDEGNEKVNVNAERVNAWNNLLSISVLRLSGGDTISGSISCSEDIYFLSNDSIPENQILNAERISAWNNLSNDFISKKDVRNILSEKLAAYNQDLLDSEKISALSIKDVISSMNAIYSTLSALSSTLSQELS